MKVGLVARGLSAGFLAGIAVAVWFLILDVSQGVPFRTPALLANGLLGRDGAEIGFVSIAAYTMIHFAAFAAVGIGVAWIVGRMPVAPGALMGVIVGFLLFDLVFYGSVVATGVDVVNELGWPGVLIGNVLAGLVLMKVLHTTGAASPGQWLHALDDHTTTREGLLAGILGAVAVAAWFLVFDTIQEVPLFTPAALGSALFFGATSVDEVQINALTVGGYTVVHFIAFAATGLTAAFIMRQAEDHPPVLLGGMVMFVAFEALFLGVLAIVAQFLMGPLAWWSIAGGNLIATLCMGLFLWRRHPDLLRDLDSKHLLDHDEPTSATEKVAA